MAAERHPAAPPEVTCRGLSRTFYGRGGAVEAVRPLDLTFAAGETTALVGPSGCGKSTLLRLIAGLEAPTTGRVEIGGETPLAVRRRAGLAVGFQDPSLLPWRTVRGNVALALRLARQPADEEAVARLIGLVGLDGFAGSRPAALSGGMRQRAAIARCLVTRPGLLLLDEPFGAVDELTRQRLAQDLPRLWEARGTTTLFVTHSVTEAVMIADRVLVFSPRPADVVEDVTVDLPRPRRADIALSDAFRALTERVSAALSAGFAAAERPLAAE
ncbi:ABC transporter ATP-binding protein [Roseitranquillus sediminis]|uniref:ABC transporter ATP-binding protein n=1 Tax=Roseitranquillus sediminis TaxID=2809051 RepID=UPI001D0CCA7C|nr:ABC transporter ATP-binding protein [Roseitranquillus sediminis]MBM9595389.1 ABC transporter ATP-binding protein [Roseitranquillus sediminis]